MKRQFGFFPNKTNIPLIFRHANIIVLYTYIKYDVRKFSFFCSSYHYRNVTAWITEQWR